MATNNTHHSFLKIFFVLFLFLVMASGLIAAVVMTQEGRSVDSQASVKSGVVKVALEYHVKDQPFIIDKPIKVALRINTNKTVIGVTQFAVRIPGGRVKDVSFLPTLPKSLKMTQNAVSSSDKQTGLDLEFISVDGSGTVIAPDTVLGTLTFTPTVLGQLPLSFDQNLSHVYPPNQPSVSVKPSAKPVTKTGSSYSPMNGKPNPSPTSSPKSTPYPPGPTSVPSSIPSPVPSAYNKDLLQTPETLILDIVQLVLSPSPSVKPTPNPSPNLKPTPAPSPTVTMTCGQSQPCPEGYECYQPPMPICPRGVMCPQVMPTMQCRKKIAQVGTPPPKASTTPTPYPVMMFQ